MIYWKDSNGDLRPMDGMQVTAEKDYSTDGLIMSPAPEFMGFVCDFDYGTPTDITEE